MTLVHDMLIEDRIFQQQHANKRQYNDPKIKINNFIYLSTKNLAIPKGRASKLVPKYTGPYKVTVRATPLNIPKRALCGLYKNSGSGEMRLMG